MLAPSAKRREVFGESRATRVDLHPSKRTARIKTDFGTMCALRYFLAFWMTAPTMSYFFFFFGDGNGGEGVPFGVNFSKEVGVTRANDSALSSICGP